MSHAVPHKSSCLHIPYLVAWDEPHVSVGGLLARERGIRSNFVRAAKEDVHARNGGKGRAQRVKRDREGRTKEYTAKERQAQMRARRK